MSRPVPSPSTAGIPGHHFPPVILGSFLVYLFSFFRVPSDEEDSRSVERISRQSKADDAALQELLLQDERSTLAEGATNKGLEGSILQQGNASAESRKAEEEDLQIAQSLLTGLPSPNFLWSMTTLGINALLALMVADMVFRGPVFYESKDLSFVRVGYVSDKSAKLLVREPDPLQLPLFISYRPEPLEGRLSAAVDGSWILAEKLYYLSPETDFTRALTISKLRPSTRYAYSISNNQSGTFITAPNPGSLHTSSSTSKLTFLTTSCIKPRFPYSPFSHPLSIPSLDILSSLLPRLRASFMLFLGDFIYIDVPQRFGSDADTYRAEYRRVYASPSWGPVSNHPTHPLPWIHVIDDHEIANDWDKGASPPYPAALEPWKIYHHSLNPPPPPNHPPNTTSSTFTHGPASFFLLDTRSFRSPITSLNSTDPRKSMLGPRQLQAVLSWLQRPEPHGVAWKILVSSVPFTRNWRVNSLDGWAGYLAERQVLLEAMWDANSQPHGGGLGMVVLSGDRHEFAATSFPAPRDKPEHKDRWGEGATVTEFSCSPLSMFYLPVRTYREIEGEQSG
ncbi:MAG: hypothetical protein LQ340_007031, partial [Diploschistes diacapsis]